MFYVNLSKNAAIMWALYSDRHPNADYDVWFRKFSKNPKTKGFLGRSGKLVDKIDNALYFSTIDEAYEAIDRSRFSGENWDGAINSV